MDPLNAGDCAWSVHPVNSEQAPEGRRRERGVVLVIVLWTLALLAVLAGAFSTATRTHASLAYNVIEQAKAEALADAAISRAIAGLILTPEDGGLRVDQTPYAWSFDGGEVVFAISDEGGKFDLNAASPELLSEIFAALGIAQRDSLRLADAVYDFHDEDDEPLPAGAEVAEYRRAGKPYGPKNKPFERIDELGLVLGFTPDLVALVRPLFTVYTGMAEPVPELIPPQYRAAVADVLTSLGSDTSLSVDTPDGGRLTSQRPQQQTAASQRRASTTNTEMLRSLRDEGTDRRSDLNIYTIHAEARSQGGAIFVREAVVLVEPTAVPAFRFLDIRQGSRAFFVDRSALN